MRATAVLKEKGISVQHMHVSTLKPFTDPTIVEAIKKSKYGVVTIKNHLDIGGLGSAVADVIAENGLGKRLVKIGLPGYPHGASQMYLMKKYGIPTARYETFDDAHAAVAYIEKMNEYPVVIKRTVWRWARAC